MTAADKSITSLDEKGVGDGRVREHPIVDREWAGSGERVEKPL